MSAPFIARIVGSIQWMCPNCSWLHGSKTLSWRRPRIKCGNCMARWIVGIATRSYEEGLGRVPTNAFRALLPWTNGTINTTELQELIPAIARFTGTVEMHCPRCGHYSRGPIGKLHTETRCGHCGIFTYVVPLLHRLDVHSSRYSPIDWTPNRETTAANV